MMVLDSNVWIALYNESDSQHQRALRLSASFSNVAISEYVLLETCTLLLTKAGPAAAEKFLAYSLDSADVTILYSSPDFFHETAHFFRRLKNKKLSFVDVSLLMLSESHKVVTFDRALVNAIKARR